MSLIEVVRIQQQQDLERLEVEHQVVSVAFPRAPVLFLTSLYGSFC